MNGLKRMPLFLGAALLLIAISGCGKSGVAACVKQGVAAAEAGDWEKALKFASSGVERAPKNLDALLLKALAARKCGRHSVACEAAAKAVKAAPDNFSAQFMLGWVCMDDPSRRGDARQAFRAALKLRPGDRDSLIALCNLAAEDGDAELAGWLEQLETSHPEFAARSAAFQNQRGVAYMRAGRYREAGAAFAKAVKMIFNDPRIVYNAACVGDRLRSVPKWRLRGWYEQYLELTQGDRSAAESRQLVMARLRDFVER